MDWAMWHMEIGEKRMKKNKKPSVLPERLFIEFWNYKGSINDAGYSYHVTYLQFKNENGF